jgi:hypothetical protein
VRYDGMPFACRVVRPLWAGFMRCMLLPARRGGALQTPGIERSGPRHSVRKKNRLIEVSSGESRSDIPSEANRSGDAEHRTRLIDD